jgi:gliding motility-associated-like protein
VTTSTVNINSCKNFQWNGQVYVESGQYYQTVLGSRGCDSTITLNFNVVILNSTIDTTICKGLNYYGHSTSGNYKDSFVTANGCDSVRNLKLTVVRLPNPELGPNVNLCKDEIITLNPGSFTTYLWQDGSQSPDYVVKDPGTYNVRVSNSCGSATDQVTVTANDCTLYFPSAFSPNNDGRNDLFKALTYNNLKEFHLMVYSRDGQKIFDTRNYTKGWNGKFEGLEMAAGVYAWYCEYKTPGQSGSKSAKGVVMLVR